MKNLIFISILLTIGINIKSQTTIKDQPGQTYFKSVEKAIIDKTIPEKELLALKASPIPENFMDTLKKYDWAYMGGYFYTDKKYTCYENFYKEYKIIRYDDNGGQLEFSINGHQNYIINSLNFSNPPCKHVAISKSGNSTFFQSKVPDGTEYQKIHSWQNGVLIYLVTKSGKMSDTRVFFKECYVAIPKGFTWNYNE